MERAGPRIHERTWRGRAATKRLGGHRKLADGGARNHWTVTGQDKIGDRGVWVVEAEDSRGSEKLYFDAQSGLRLRRLQLRDSPLGPVPFQMEFGDYRDVDGVKVPFISRWTKPDVTLTFRYSEMRHNAPIEDGKFEKPRTP